MEKIEDYQSEFSDCVQRIVASNILFRNELENEEARRDVMSMDSFATIKVAANRRIGHTTAMFETARRFFKQPLFAFPNNSQREYFIRQKGCSSKECCTPSTTNALHDIVRDAILVDNASYFSNSEMEKIKYLAERMYNVNTNFCFILIG
jgi:hypothetical protein